MTLRSSSRGTVRLTVEKRRLVCLQEGQRHSNPMLFYLLPFVLGLAVGCGVVAMAYLQCWEVAGAGSLWTCREKDVEMEILLQVAPVLQPNSIIPQVAKEVSGQSSSNSINATHSLRGRHHVVSLMSGCPDRPLHFVILILSSPGASVRRTAIRGTWLHDYRNKVVKVTMKFLIGLYDLKEELVASLKREEELFEDMLLLQDLKDSYRNLTTKVLLGLQWADGLEFDYLAKVDDDSYVRIEGLSSAARKMDCDAHLYWGYFMGYAFPELTGKWEEHKWFQCPHYLPYAMGGGYVLSRAVVRALMRFPHRLILYSNEDVTVASWLAPYHLTRKHDLRFDVESLSHGCNNGYLIAHKERVRNFYNKYSSLTRNGTLCMVEREIQPAYVYNWTKSPLHCCERKWGIPVL